MASRVGAGSRSVRALARSAMPGMQNPHCRPAVAVKQSEICWRSALGRPSSVTMCLPWATRAGMAQVVFGLPSTSATQQPHWPCGLQPSFNEVMPQRSRSTSRKFSPGRVSTRCLIPFSTNSISMMICPHCLRLQWPPQDIQGLVPGLWSSGARACLLAPQQARRSQPRSDSSAVGHCGGRAGSLERRAVRGAKAWLHWLGGLRG